MNMYFVISELLTEIVWEDRREYLGHYEEYRLFGLAIARNRSQAKYLVARSDGEWSCIQDIPRMSIRKLGDGLEGPARLVSEDKEFEDWWDQIEDMFPPDYVEEEK